MAKGTTTTNKNTVQKKTGAGAAMSAHSKDAGKQAPAKKAVLKKPAEAKTAQSSKKTAAKSPSFAGKVLRTVKATASGALNLAGSIVGRDNEKSR